MNTLSLIVSCLGLVAGAVVFLASRKVTTALACMLELWLAAGLLHLSEAGSWRALAVAAAVVLVRKLVVSAQPAGGVT